MSTIPLDLETDTVVLPPPALSPQVTLERALKRRHSTRTFLPDALPLDTLSALLWAGFGINRPETVRRTAPSAHDRRSLARALGLTPSQRITLAQTVGYPGGEALEETS